MKNKRLAVIGCGLIGGSICLAIGKRRREWEVVALDLAAVVPSLVEHQISEKIGSLDEAEHYLPESSIVVLAMPVGEIVPALEKRGR